MIVLGIETSCDDTSLALFSPERGVIEVLTANQLVHEKYGGVVPEIASRQHLKTLLPVFAELLARDKVDEHAIDGIGVSNGPGLLGSLLVGVGFAKALAMALQIPIVGVHHIEAHILANELQLEELRYPCLVLVVSGGHTCLYRVDCAGRYTLLGTTRDDAAGEAFDKIAKLLGLGFPGGPAVEEAAKPGNKDAVHFPRAMLGKNEFDFSFSGLKTAVRLYIESRNSLDQQTIADIAASAQEAIVDVLVQKTIACAKKHKIAHAYLAGGVAANGSLRKCLKTHCEKEGMTYHAPLIQYCTDNAAMVACAAAKQLSCGRNDGLDLDVFARGPVTSWA
ncbi:MAG: tRNA (adenosine(37)-N6)-threonylcarbamoyltransferase complex transferase subunit TsaD [Candidatus Latescibacteria bacterium]|nr:tRNA (adenosine(37)-N6)-threonylcarbamoyltransferase complex transferase subunit TsaD [Candidatus Latescibacterota bacterium]NIM22596.1 tRNA (adenosine(37)-N6)-threonylcarbamoyltransferase complex transferase subunit TsaD [Candidatus Latescibacterota bacterium]NIM64885.1 tRNA (adenosine(37)-N6)-threonylcarbamoyltransferase complex transferase subunit TsaD [Candidatus Latescibacterota bacterium]NIO01400.1 tRNA (adenosine(37)-N6)-threonylcarbamoyltransferase complex transferase subunit TsaD [Ca